MSDSQPREASTYLWARGPHRRDVPVDFQSIHTYDWWQAEEAAGNERIRAFRDLTPADVTPEVTLELAGTLLQEIARVALLTKVMALENAPRKRGRPPKEKMTVVPVVGESAQAVNIPHRPLSPDEARALGSLFLQAAQAAEATIEAPLPADEDEFIDYDEVISTTTGASLNGHE